MSENYFTELYAVNVSEKIEKKNNLSYLSWAWAWAELKKRHPDAISTVYENKDGWIYHTDGKTAWVKTGVTVNGIEHIEYLPIMNYQNKSIPLDSITSYDVNKSIQRSMTKAIGRHGIGLSIYAGEDLPEDTKADIKTRDAPKPSESQKRCTELGDKLGITPAERKRLYEESGRSFDKLLARLEAMDTEKNMEIF